jgi:hypothetical protein
MMLGTVELHRLEDFFAGMAFGQGRSIALLRNDGTLLARYPSADDVPGTKLPDGIAALGDRQAVATRERMTTPNRGRQHATKVGRQILHALAQEKSEPLGEGADRD